MRACRVKTVVVTTARASPSGFRPRKSGSPPRRRRCWRPSDPRRRRPSGTVHRRPGPARLGPRAGDERPQRMAGCEAERDVAGAVAPGGLEASRSFEAVVLAVVIHLGDEFGRVVAIQPAGDGAHPRPASSRAGPGPGRLAAFPGLRRPGRPRHRPVPPDTFPEWNRTRPARRRAPRVQVHVDHSPARSAGWAQLGQRLEHLHVNLRRRDSIEDPHGENNSRKRPSGHEGSLHAPARHGHGRQLRVHAVPRPARRAMAKQHFWRARGPCQRSRRSICPAGTGRLPVCCACSLDRIKAGSIQADDESARGIAIPRAPWPVDRSAARAALSCCA